MGFVGFRVYRVYRVYVRKTFMYYLAIGFPYSMMTPAQPPALGPFNLFKDFKEFSAQPCQLNVQKSLKKNKWTDVVF